MPEGTGDQPPVNHGEVTREQLSKEHKEMTPEKNPDQMNFDQATAQQLKMASEASKRFLAEHRDSDKPS